MKRLFIVIITALVLYTAVLAAPTITLEHIIDEDNLTVSAVLSENPGIVACDFVVGYDNTRLVFISAATAYGGVFVNDNNPSEVKIVWMNSEGNITSDGPLFNMHFQIIDDSAPADVTLSIMSMINESFQDVPFIIASALTISFDEADGADCYNDVGVNILPITITGFGNTTGQPLVHYRIRVLLSENLVLADAGYLSRYMDLTQDGRILEWYAKNVPPGFAEDAVITLDIRPDAEKPPDKAICIVTFGYIQSGGLDYQMGLVHEPSQQNIWLERVRNIHDRALGLISTPLLPLKTQSGAGEETHLLLPWFPVLLLIAGICIRLYRACKNFAENRRK